MGRAGGTIAGVALATTIAFAIPPSHAQTLNESLANRAQPQGKDRLLVEAKEIVYNQDLDQVEARGDVELNFQGRTLQADRVVYDRKTGRVTAMGNARMTEANGASTTGSRFELTDDFKDGFIDSLRVKQTGKFGQVVATTYFSAPRAERTDGETTVFERGAYTACEPCKEDPERPPFWQVKAARIIHNNSERTIYYENATIELYGLPVAYFPYFWSPDPTVKRKTGFLAPRYAVSSSLGTGVGIPFFWAIAPNYDLTVQPTYYSKQGLLGQAEWRHRLLNGSYNIRAAGIFQQGQNEFLPSPLGPREKDFRGSVETTGRFFLSDRWKFGWDVALVTDKWFFQNYHIHSESLSALSQYFRESTSTVYLQGQGDRSWFDLRGYYFKGLSTFDWQKQLPVVHPVLDYNKRVDGPGRLGGELAYDFNLTSLTRDAAAFQQIPSPLAKLFPGTPYGGLYDTCAVFQRGLCIVRGLSGTFTRVSAQVSWRRAFIDDAGQVWTPFAYFRTDGFFNAPDRFGYENPNIANFVGTDTEFVGRAMPAIGLEYRYPLVAQTASFGTHTVEPIAQIIARPNEARIGRLPNEDAQSLVFDDSNILDWDKFSGYDRSEGGVRANLAAQYSIRFANGGYANALFGQSFHLAGQNPFARGDLVNIGPSSGLDTKASDYVARVQVQPNQNLSFTTRARFDNSDYDLKRFEAGMTTNWNPVFPLTTTLMYARYARQPELGYNNLREGLVGVANYNVTPRWALSASALVDFSRYLTDRDIFATQFLQYQALLPTNPELAPPLYKKSAYWSLGALSLGAVYSDECTTFAVSYTTNVNEIVSGAKEPTQTLLVRLELKTLGQINFKQAFGATSTQDGIASTQQ